MLEVNNRDLKKKGKSLRNKGIITGMLKRKNGQVYNIQMNGNDLDTLVARSGLNLSLPIRFQGDLINTRIDIVQRDVIYHNIINVDLLEVWNGASHQWKMNNEKMKNIRRNSRGVSKINIFYILSF